MKHNDRWLSEVTMNKLVEIRDKINSRFGDNDSGRGHWLEVEFIRKCLRKTINPHVKLLLTREHGTSPIRSLCWSNSSFDVQNYPTYIFRYLMSKDNKCTIEKVFSCGDSGVFACDKPLKGQSSLQCVESCFYV